MMQSYYDEATEKDMDPNRPISPGGGIAIRLFVVVLIVAGIFMFWRFAGSGASLHGWHQDIDSAMDEAESSGKPIYVLYTADWCPPCRQFKKDVLTNQDVSQLLESKFVRVKIDLTDRFGPNNKVANKYNVRAVPTMIVYTAQGVEIDSVQGGQSHDYFLLWLNRCLQTASGQSISYHQ